MLLNVANEILGNESASLLAEGGQRVVYRGTSAQFGDVVVKLSERNDRTDREILQMQHLKLPYVPLIFSSGETTSSGKPYTYVIEQFIEGSDLRKILNEYQVLPLNECRNLLHELLYIAASYEPHNIVHRDIKPENIVINKTNDVWLLDFGIARHLDQISLTATHLPHGPASLGYCSPEQLMNRKSDLDIRSDLFSIGLVVLEAATGKNPMTYGARDHVAVMERITNLDIPRMPAIDKTGKVLSTMVATLTSRVISNRPPSAAIALEWLSDLES